ncbi:MAG TPA: hypothetical protein VF198_03760 [Vicinamibacterales bacterium]
MPRCSWADCGRWRPGLLARGGLVMNGDWYCSAECAGRQASDDVARAAALEQVRSRALPRLKVGLLLVHHGAVTPVQLREALAAQQSTGRRLGAELVARGATDPAAVVKALAAQAGVPCLTTLDRSAVRLCPELGAHAVQALGLVPFAVDQERRAMKVACAAPVPRLAVGALRELTGWHADVFLVPDEVLPELVDEYAALATEAGADECVVSREAAGPRIAEAASALPGAVVSQARIDPWLWVRVSDGRVGRNLFVATQEDPSWQAVLTSH